MVFGLEKTKFMPDFMDKHFKIEEMGPMKGIDILIRSGLLPMVRALFTFLLACCLITDIMASLIVAVETAFLLKRSRIRASSG